jgi:hypothetical protein
VLIAQVWTLPAESAVNAPLGGEDWLYLLSPQHAIVPSVLMPHEWSLPAANAANVPDGGTALPSVFSPQHATVPSDLSAQA